MNDAKQKHIMEMIERQNRQFEIVRKGLREAARILNEINSHLDETVTFEESSGCVFQDLGIPKPPELELELDMAELQDEIERTYIIDVTDDMIVEPPRVYSVIDELEKFLGNVQSYRSTLH